MAALDQLWKSLKEIATREGIDNSYVSRMVNLTTLLPDIVAAILDDALPNHITLFALAIQIRRRCGMSNVHGLSAQRAREVTD